MPDHTDHLAEGALSWVHAGRLRAAERELLSLAAELRGIATEGRPLALPSSAHAYTPLPAGAAGPFGQALDRLAALAHGVGALVGPDPHARAPQGPAATRMALSSRLSRVEDTLKDLDPEQLQARYGELPPARAAQLQELCHHLRQTAREAREVLELHADR